MSPKPADVAVALQFSLTPDAPYRELAGADGISHGEAHNAVRRLLAARERQRARDHLRRSGGAVQGSAVDGDHVSDQNGEVKPCRRNSCSASWALRLRHGSSR